MTRRFIIRDEAGRIIREGVQFTGGTIVLSDPRDRFLSAALDVSLVDNITPAGRVEWIDGEAFS